MAITKIIAIRDRLDKRVNYAVNGEKTTLDAGITYATSPEKTEQHFFTSALNCESCETAYAEMQVTKRRFGKLGGVVGYHFIQSLVGSVLYHISLPPQEHQKRLVCIRLSDDAVNIAANDTADGGLAGVLRFPFGVVFPLALRRDSG